jgi:hypothetical protein
MKDRTESKRALIKVYHVVQEKTRRKSWGVGEVSVTFFTWHRSWGLSF